MSDLNFETVSVLGTGLVAALFLTTRVDRVGAEHYQRFRRAGSPVIFVFWHGQLLPLVHYHRQEGIVVLVSEHADGEYISRVLGRNGFGTVRGSSTRGGIRGLKGLVRAARDGKDLALTPDGPRGPRGAFKPGALVVAQMTGLPVIPLSVGASAGWRMRSWDGFLVPRPLSRITIQYLPARFVSRTATREQLESMAVDIGRDLNEMGRRLDPDESRPIGRGGEEGPPTREEPV